MSDTEVTWCTTHRQVVPPGFVSSIQTRANGEWVPRQGVCPGYGRVEAIDSDGFAELDRDQCKFEQLVPKRSCHAWSDAPRFLCTKDERHTDDHEASDPATGRVYVTWSRKDTCTPRVNVTYALDLVVSCWEHGEIAVLSNQAPASTIAAAVARHREEHL